MTKRSPHDTAQHAFDLITGEIERARKLEKEIQKLRKTVSEMQIAAASALGYIRRHHGNSSEGYAVRKLLLETVRRAA